MANILIDGRFVGIGDSQTRYVLELTRNILKLDQKNSYTLLLRPAGLKQLEFFSGIEGKPNLKLEVLDVPHYSIPEQTVLLKYLNDKKFDLVHFTQFNHPIFYRSNYVITIQDLTLVGHLHYFNFIKQLAFNSVMKSAARDSKAIIAISKETENDVIDFFGTPKEKFTLIYHGIDHDRFNQKVREDEKSIKEFKQKYNTGERYILYTGMWKKHKNLLRMFKAFEKFWGENSDQDIKLVLTGKIDQKEPEVIAEIERINSKKKIILTTGFIEEGELPIAYAGALAYCIPSLSEGFGWPPLEAMACGTPAIASNTSCIPEILGNAALYFDPYNIDEMAEKMGDISKDEALRKDLISKGLKQVQKYSWAESAKKTLEVYKKLLI